MTVRWWVMATKGWSRDAILKVGVWGGIGDGNGPSQLGMAYGIGLIVH